MKAAAKTGIVVTIEDNTVKGGFGSNVLEMLNKNGLSAKTGIFGFPDTPILTWFKKRDI